MVKSHIIFTQITTVEDRSSINNSLEHLNSNYLNVGLAYQYINQLIKLIQPLSSYSLSRGKFANDLMIEIGSKLKKKQY